MMPSHKLSHNQIEAIFT